MPSAQPEEQDQSMVDVVDEVQEEEIDEDKELELGENRVTVVCSLSFLVTAWFGISSDIVLSSYPVPLKQQRRFNSKTKVIH
jgi:hypothetical protein